MWGRERSILVVSGERPSPGLRPGFLEASGLRLTQAVADPEVLDLARARPFDLIILDLTGESEPGLALCRRLKFDPATRATPVVVIAADETAPSARLIGVEAVVRRPIVAREYHEAIGRFVRLPKRRVRRRLVNLRLTYETDAESGQAFTRDLSACGAFLKTDRAPTVGTTMRITFSIPGHLCAVHCEAIVRRLAPSDDDRLVTPGFAIEFCGMSEEDTDRLDRFLGRA